MLKSLSAIAAAGLLVGLAVSSAAAQSPGARADRRVAADTAVAEAADFGGELGGRRFAPEADAAPRADAAPGIRPVAAAPRACMNGGDCVADPEKARQVLGALLASMGAREAPPAEMVQVLAPDR